jgi:hypothetical protein
VPNSDDQCINVPIQGLESNECADCGDHWDQDTGSQAYVFKSPLPADRWPLARALLDDLRLILSETGRSAIDLDKVEFKSGCTIVRDCANCECSIGYKSQ